jgi:hypothetical protein
MPQYALVVVTQCYVEAVCALLLREGQQAHKSCEQSHTSADVMVDCTSLRVTTRIVQFRPQLTAVPGPTT